MDDRSVDLGTRYLKATIADRVLHVRIDRAAKRNAITQDMYRGLKRPRSSPTPRSELDALCLTGSGDVFAVGGDMSGESEIRTAWRRSSTPPITFRSATSSSAAGSSSPRQRPCHAGGLNLVLFSDLAVASERATSGPPSCGAASRSVDRVAPGRVRRHRRRQVPVFHRCRDRPRDAAALGLIAKDVPHNELAAQVEWTLEQIRLTAPKARAMVKEDLNRRLPSPDAGLFRRSILSPEMAEGFAAFLEKRRPVRPRE